MLDFIDQGIRQELCASRLKLIELSRPLIGDLVLWPNGETRRISHDWDDSFQTSRANAGSFHTFAGGASFSGSLQPAVFAEFLVKTNEVQQASFWFFSHKQAGAGRGVQCELPCRVWRLQAFRRSREEAEKHPRAIKSKEFWGSNVREYEKVLDSIMNPLVLENPDYY